MLIDHLHSLKFQRIPIIISNIWFLLFVVFQRSINYYILNIKINATEAVFDRKFIRSFKKKNARY